MAPISPQIERTGLLGQVASALVAVGKQTRGMTMRHATMLILASVILSGCVSQADRIASYRDLCRQYGYQEGTTAFARCVQSEEREAFERTQRGWQHLQDAGRHLDGAYYQ